MKKHLLLIALLFPYLAGAAVRLPHLFSHGMVLQREQPVPFSNWTDHGEAVKTEYLVQNNLIGADATGERRLRLPRHQSSPEDLKASK